jgi:hypothetical protein
VDPPAGDQAYRSQAGYSFTLPAGWLEWTEELGRMFGVGPPLPGNELFVHAGFFGDHALLQRGDTTWTSRMSFAAHAPLPANVPLDAVGRALQARLATTLPGLREFTIGRARIGPRDVVEARGRYGPPAGPGTYYQVEIPGPGRSVTLSCLLTGDADVETCRRVAEGVTFP